MLFLSSALNFHLSFPTPQSSLSCLTASSARLVLMSHKHTLAPWLKSCLANSSPRPWAPPVIMALRPLGSKLKEAILKLFRAIDLNLIIDARLRPICYLHVRKHLISISVRAISNYAYLNEFMYHHVFSLLQYQIGTILFLPAALAQVMNRQISLVLLTSS